MGITTISHSPRALSPHLTCLCPWRTLYILTCRRPPPCHLPCLSGRGSDPPQPRALPLWQLFRATSCPVPAHCQVRRGQEGRREREMGPQGSREGRWGRGQVLEFPQSFLNTVVKLEYRKGLSGPPPGPSLAAATSRMTLGLHWWVMEESCGTEHLSCNPEKQIPVCMMIGIPLFSPLSDAPFRVPLGAGV